MVGRTAYPSLFVLLGLAVCSVWAVSVQQKVLVITPEGDFNLAATIRTLKSYGVFYETLMIPAAGLASPLSLEVTANSVGKYSLIVLSYWYQLNKTLTTAQFAEIETYRARYKTRLVSIYALPDPVRNYADFALPASGCCEANVEHLAVFSPTAPTAAAGIKNTAELSTLGLYHYPAVITNTTYATPFLYLKAGHPLFPAQTVAGSIIRRADKSEEMVFFIPFGDWSITSLVLGHVWLVWGTRGLFIGSRRVQLNTQVDDFFLGTELVIMGSEPQRIYRSSIDDMIALNTWQLDITKRMPPGSKYKVELAFNGNGIPIQAFENSSTGNALEIDTENYVDLNFKMPLGQGDNRWPNPVPSDATLGITSATAALDPLYAWFKGSLTRLSAFNWVSHTFTHENLNNVNARDVDLEIKTNIKVAKLLSLTGKAYWSKNSMVTPQISGVFNGDALRTLAENGITNIVGDNSRSNLIAAGGLWYPLITTLASSNYAGYTIIPRGATEIYYLCSTPEENRVVYDSIYFALLGNSTWEQILEREANRMLYKMLSVTYDGNMFHQANLRQLDTTVTVGTGTGKLGLMQQWVESVLAKYLQYATWPITTTRQDDLATIFLNRAAIDACGITTTLNYNSANTQIVSVTIKTTGACKVPLTVPANINKNLLQSLTGPPVSYDQLKPDPLVVWTTMSAGTSVSYTLSPALTVA